MLPSVGEIYEGYRFIGGDPNDEKSWEKFNDIPKQGDIVDGYRFRGGNPRSRDAWERFERKEQFQNVEPYVPQTPEEQMATAQITPTEARGGSVTEMLPTGAPVTARPLAMPVSTPSVETPEERRLRLLGLGAVAEEAIVSPAPAPTRPGPTVEAAKQLEQQRVIEAARENLGDILYAQAQSQDLFKKYKNYRELFAQENPLAGAAMTGAAGMTTGMANVPSVAADAFNQTFINPVLSAAGLPQIPRVTTAFGTEFLAKAASDYMPEVGKQGMEEAYKKGEFGAWLASKVAANSPQMAQQLAAAFIPPLRPLMLGTLSATTAGQSFAEGDDPRVAVAKGTVEYVTEKIPLGVFDKVNDLLKGMSPAKQNVILAVVGQRLLKAGGAITINGITNTIEEVAAQFGGNVLDRYFQGKDIALTKDLGEAAVVGGVTGKIMSAPQVAAIATGRYEPAAILARSLEGMEFAPIRPLAIGGAEAEQARTAALQAWQTRGLAPSARTMEQVRDDVQAAQDVDSAITTAERAVSEVPARAQVAATAPAAQLPLEIPSAETELARRQALIEGVPFTEPIAAEPPPAAQPPAVPTTVPAAAPITQVAPVVPEAAPAPAEVAKPFEDFLAVRDIPSRGIAKGEVVTFPSEKQAIAYAREQKIPETFTPREVDDGWVLSQPMKEAPAVKTEGEKDLIIQNRNRSTPASIAQMRGIAANPDYGRLGFSKDFANGAPVVFGGDIPQGQIGRKDVAIAQDGRRIPVSYAVVEADSLLASNKVDGTVNADYGNLKVRATRAVAGNGRIAGLQAAYADNAANTYRQELIDDDLHGVSKEAIASLKNPVLIRIMPDEMVTKDIGDVSNTSAALKPNAVEQAKNDRNRIDLNGLQFAPDGSVTQNTLAQFVRAMPQTEQGELIDTNGKITTQAEDRLNAAIFSKAYDNDDLVELYAQARDPEAKLVLSALAQVASKMARLDGTGDFDFRSAVTRAAEAAVNARRTGLTLDEAARQVDLTVSDPAVQEILSLFARNTRSAKRIVQALGTAADMAYAEANKPSGDMLGDVPKRPIQDIIKNLNEYETSQLEIREGATRVRPVETQRGSEQAIAEADIAVEEGIASREDFSSEPIQTPKTDSPANIFGGVRLIEGGLNKSLQEEGSTTIVGHVVKSAADLAEAAQVYRKPYEVFRAFFVDADGKIIHQTGVSARLPNRTGIIPGNLAEGDKMVSRWFNLMVEKTGAKGFYILHNHPSGDPSPSVEDVNSTLSIAKNPAFLGHVIIDSTDFVEIRKTGTPYKFKLKEPRDDKLRKYIINNGVVGGKILNSIDVARVGKMLTTDKNMSVVIAYGERIEAIGEIPNEVLTHPVRGPAAIRRFARFNAGADVFIYTTDTIKSGEQMFSLYERGFVTDAVSENGKSIVEAVGISPRRGEFGDAQARLIRQRSPERKEAIRKERLINSLVKGTGVSANNLIAYPEIYSAYQGVKSLIRQAPIVKTRYDARMARLADRTGMDLLAGPVKKFPRAFSKVWFDYKGDYTKIGDIVRSTLVVEDIRELRDMIRAVTEFFPGVTLKRNGWGAIIPEDPTGYRDVFFKGARIGGYPVELQINFREMVEAKEKAHKLYQEQDELRRRILSVEKPISRGDRSAAEDRINELQSQQFSIYLDAGQAVFDRANVSRQSLSVILSPSDTRVETLNVRGASSPVAAFASQAERVPSAERVTGMPLTSQKVVPSGKEAGISIPILPEVVAKERVARGMASEQELTQRRQNAIQEPSAAEVPVREGTRGGEAVGERDAQRQEAAREGRVGEAGAEEVGGLFFTDRFLGDENVPGQPRFGRELRNPVRLKDGTRLDGFTDSSQTTFSGYTKNGDRITMRVDSINPDDVIFSRDGNKTAEAVKEALSKPSIIKQPPAQYEGRVVKDSDVEAIARMSEEQRDDTYPADLPGGFPAFNLYEARKLLPKPSDKLKRVTDKNTFDLHNEQDYIANVDGKHFGITKQEDPDDPDNEEAFVYAYERLDRPFSLKTTITSDVGELFAIMRDSLAKEKVEAPARQPTQLSMFQPPAPYGANRATVDHPEPSRVDDIIRLLQDKNIDLKRVIDRVRESGAKVGDAFDPYLQEGLAVSRMAAADADFKNNELTPLLEEAGRLRITLATLEEYLHARHAPSRNREMAKRNPTKEELDAKIKEIDSEIKKELAKNRAVIDEAINRVPRLPGTGAPIEEIEKATPDTRRLESLYKEKQAWQKIKPWSGTEEERQSLSGMSTEDAEKYLNSLYPEKRAKLERLAERVDEIIAKTKAMLIQGGVDSAESFNDSWDYYVPLHREGKEESGFGYGQGFSVKGKSTRTATGSTRKVVDIIANIAAARDQAITRVEKNRVANAMVGFAMLNQDPSLWRVDVAPKTAVLDKATGKVVMRHDPNYKSNENVLVARMPDGKGGIVEHAVVFNEESPTAMRIVAAMKGLDSNELGRLLTLNAKITRFMASMNTQYNPIFGVVNLVRDLQSSAINIQGTEIAGKQKELISEATKALGQIYLELRAQRRGEKRDSEYSRLFEEFRKEGGQTGFRDAWTLSGDKTKQMETIVNRAMATGLARTGYQAANALSSVTKDLLSDYNTTLENAIRVAAYKIAKEQGLSKARAAMLAKDVTVNFNRKGTLSNQIGAGYAFFNAAVQGTERLGRVLDIKLSPNGIPTMGPRGQKIVTGGVLIGVVQALALVAAGIGDDEIPEFIKEKNLIIPLGLIKNTKLFSEETMKRGYITIPMPLGLHVLPNLGRISTEFALGGFKDPGKNALKMFSVMAEAFNPLGTAAGLQTLFPTTLDPIIALTENKDWTGKPIYRESIDKLGSVPGFERAKDNPSYIGMAIAKGLNKLSGGTEFSSGAISPTPEAIEYLIAQATGGPGRELTKVQKMISGFVTGDEVPPSNIPLVSRFYGEVRNQTAQGERFYGNIKTLLRHGREIKGIENMEEEIGRSEAEDRIDAYKAKNPEAEIWEEARSAMREVQKLRLEKRNAIKENAPKEEINDYNTRITEYMADFNARVKEFRQQ